MEAIRKGAEECWIPDPEKPDTIDLDEPRFIELVRKSYKYISEPEESIVYDEDGDAWNFTCNILAEQAVLDDNVAFFLKIIADCELSDVNDLFFAAVVKTQRFHFIKIMFEQIDLDPAGYLYGFETLQQALEAIECLSFVVPLEELFERKTRRSIHYLPLAMAFLQKGIPFERVFACCDPEVATKLKEEDV